MNNINEDAAKDRVIEVDLEHPPTPNLTGGVLARLDARRERKQRNLMAALLVLGLGHITNVTGLDNGKVLISYYSSGPIWAPLFFILGDVETGKSQEFKSEFVTPTFSRYGQHNYVVARKDCFVVVSDHPAGWNIEVRKSSDGSLIKRWTYKTYTPLKDVEETPGGKKDEEDKTAESEEKD